MFAFSLSRISGLMENPKIESGKRETKLFIFQPNFSAEHLFIQRLQIWNDIVMLRKKYRDAQVQKYFCVFICEYAIVFCFPGFMFSSLTFLSICRLRNFWKYFELNFHMRQDLHFSCNCGILCHQGSCSMKPFFHNYPHLTIVSLQHFSRWLTL